MAISIFLSTLFSLGLSDQSLCGEISRQAQGEGGVKGLELLGHMKYNPGCQEGLPWLEEMNGRGQPLGGDIIYRHSCFILNEKLRGVVFW